MKINQLSGPPSPELASALAEFELPFTYPLGPEKFFRISHGEDYTLFFRAQGEGACFIAEDQGRVVGALGTAVRRLWMPDGGERSAAYFGDLKIAGKARGGAVLVRLARAAEDWLRPKVEAGFGVVMGGTSLTPEAYTGRAGIPGFQELGRLMVFRLSGTGKCAEDQPSRFLTSAETGLASYRRLSRGRYACPASDAQARSEHAEGQSLAECFEPVGADFGEVVRHGSILPGAADNARALGLAVDWCAAARGGGAFRITSQLLPVYTHPEVGYRVEARAPHDRGRRSEQAGLRRVEACGIGPPFAS